MIGATLATARAAAFAVVAMLSFAASAAFEEPVEVMALVESVIAEINAGYDDPVVRLGGPIAVSEATDEPGYDFVVNLPEVALVAVDSGDRLELGSVNLLLGGLDTEIPRFKFAVPEAITGWLDGPISIDVEAGRVEGAWHSAVGILHALTVDANSILINAPQSEGLKITTGPLHLDMSQAEPSGEMIVNRGQGSWQDLRLFSTKIGTSFEIDKITAIGDQRSPTTFLSSGALADAQARLRSSVSADETAQAVRDLIAGGYYDKVDWRVSFHGARALFDRQPTVLIDAMTLSGGAADLSKPTGTLRLNFDVQGFDDKAGLTRAPGEVVPSQLALAVRLQDLALPDLIHALQPQLAENAALGDEAASELFRRTLGLHLATAGTRVAIETANAANDHYAVESDALIHWTDADPANATADARVVTTGLRGLMQTLANNQDDPTATQIMGMLGLVAAFGKPDGDPAADRLTYDIKVRPGDSMRVNGRAMGPSPKRQP